MKQVWNFLIPIFALTLIFVLAACGANASQIEEPTLPLPTKIARPVGTVGKTSVTPTVTAEDDDATPTPIPAGPTPVAKPCCKMKSPEYGIQAFLWWRPETADRDAGRARDGGFGWVKQQFAWRDIEGAKKGAFDWSHSDLAVYTLNAKKIDILARMDNAPDWAAPGCSIPAKKQMGPARNQQDWIDFLKAFVTRYKGRVRAYEIWNEPNLAREWCGKPPNPVEYAALLKVSYSTIKAIDPNAAIITAGLTPTTQNNAEAMPDQTFVERLYDAIKNNSTGYFDLLGVHAPGYKAPPETSPDDVAKNTAYNHSEGAAGRIYSFRHAEDIRNVMVARGDSAKQIAILEFGWTSDPKHPAYSWFRVDEPTKGQYIVNAFKYAKANWAPWIGVMSLIYISNPDWTDDNEERWWSITLPDGTPTDQYWIIQRYLKSVGN
jgi:hypothetical protein